MGPRDPAANDVGQAPRTGEFVVCWHDEGDVPHRQLPMADAGDDLTDDYLAQVARIARLNLAQQEHLAKRIQEGRLAEKELESDVPRLRGAKRSLRRVALDGKAARRQLIEGSLRLVISRAERHAHVVPLLDLVQEGSLGLIRAVDKFDSTKGKRFTSHAKWWVDLAIHFATVNRLLAAKIADVERDMLEEIGRQPSAEELAQRLAMTPEQVAELRQYAPEPLDLRAPLPQEVRTEPCGPLEYTYAPDLLEPLIRAQFEQEVQAVLRTLSEREARVVSLRFGLSDDRPRELEEISELFGVTRERVRQILAKAMSKLRHPSRSERLWDYYFD